MAIVAGFVLIFSVIVTYQASASSDSSLFWSLGAEDEDCHATCARFGHRCSEASWPSTLEEWKAVASRTPGLNCTHHYPGTWDFNPAICTEEGYCGGHCYWEGIGARCEGGTREFPSPIARRICPCQAQRTVSTGAAALSPIATDIFAGIQHSGGESTSCRARGDRVISEQAPFDMDPSERSSWTASAAQMLGLAAARSVTNPTMRK
mmetsp:Transcript_64528/g.124422  ORF Transcript_64528/g.124422 Transcript_64528/m.124422 type:complete len:207 (-) Transcript_64528:156-776(-)